MPITHHQASWWADHAKAPRPRYPGLLWSGLLWNRPALRNSYWLWRRVEKRGAKIHIGEFGCFNRTPDHIALRWLADILSIYKEFGWGYALWNFQGGFGIIEHGRSGAKLESMCGYNVDRTMLDLLLENRITQ
jgi:hypothetical protein